MFAQVLASLLLLVAPKFSENYLWNPLFETKPKHKNNVVVIT